VSLTSNPNCPNPYGIGIRGNSNTQLLVEDPTWASLILLKILPLLYPNTLIILLFLFNPVNSDNSVISGYLVVSLVTWCNPVASDVPIPANPVNLLILLNYFLPLWFTVDPEASINLYLFNYL